ncbi:hypothetical protein FDO65_06820 [Nakamurella flava]|uniref:Uncharacterized protein n=1 Tax=Nakamurella flava TaxID=2576308 RepID=A0A4U6QL92_9ACTN|nr:hypothetical protein [Nakamurella flava]TKV61310.1 hypothetical protein FDO65_06820 [Nakamurella flava]
MVVSTDLPSSPAACDIRDPGPPSAQTLVLWVDSGGAFGPPRDWTAAWELAAYRDGTVLRSAGDGFNSAPLSPTTIDRVDPCRVRDAVFGLQELTEADVDIPLPTDMSTTTISVRGGAPGPAGEPYGYAPPTLGWPLGSFDEVMTRSATVPACGEVTGDHVDTLLEGLGNAPAQSRWSDPYRTTLVAVAPLMPGQLGCPA